MELLEYCARYIANLRALYFLHQNYHWISNGPNFYGNHLLFERLYKSAQENSDMAAEKLIGNFGVDALCISKQPTLIKEYLEKYTSENIVQNALKAETEFLELSQNFYDFLKSEEKLSLGIDDAIMSIANDREESVYLIKQLLGKEMNKLSELANKFTKKLAQIAENPMSPDRALQFKQKLNTALAANLGNRNWGEVGFNSFSVAEQNGSFVIKCNLIIPANSPPFMDKAKYPQGLNQFKQEIMNFISNFAEQNGISDNLVQIVSVNNQ